ncbi:hypothetical protein JCM19237_914 [Photobacterium aphoticum]|uniref:Uncharacterized protein n=1 Tax=Photobacterium aphoticum TaxID=754436 RepID=A0A090QXR2_9GAMM|nr:hypothetical protein JCM19237_914 [Photobacterium aphoticum]
MTAQEKKAVEMFTGMTPAEDTVTRVFGVFNVKTYPADNGAATSRVIIKLQGQPVYMSQTALLFVQGVSNEVEVVTLGNTVVVLSVNNRYSLVDELLGSEDDDFQRRVKKQKEKIVNVENIASDAAVFEKVKQVNTPTIHEEERREAAGKEALFLQWLSVGGLAITVTLVCVWLICVTGLTFPSPWLLIAVIAMLVVSVHGLVASHHHGKAKYMVIRYRGKIHAMESVEGNTIVTVTEATPDGSDLTFYCQARRRKICSAEKR